MVLADDEPDMRRALRAIVESAGRSVVVGEAADGPGLVRACRELAPDVALVDVQMPGAGGIAAIRELRAGAAPPACAVLTTFDLDEHVSAALSCGAAGFLLKDSDPGLLERAPVDLAAGGAVLDPRITARLLPRFTAAAEPSEQTVVDALTERQRQVLALLAAGASNPDIAQRLRLAEPTVKGYVSALLTRLDVENRVQAAVVAQRCGLGSSLGRTW